MSNENNQGYVYILTNPSFREDWVKIGKSSRPVDVRSKELDNTAVPLPFEIYATLKTAKYDKVEKQIHKQIDRLTDLRIRQNREFFNIAPSVALDIMRDIADLLEDAELAVYVEGKPVVSSSKDEDKKINAANVMPIIFAQALMMFPLLFSQFDATRGFAATFSDVKGFWYNAVFAFLIIIFTYFYTTVIINPTQMADEMKKNGGFIPGVKPGKNTAEYIDSVMSRITLPGSIFLAIVGILPALAMIVGVNNQFAQFYGGTSLLIMVGVVLDTLQQIESHLLMRHYDGLTKTGRLKGR